MAGGIFKQKTEEERAAEEARKAEAAFWSSPQGKATQAFDRGDQFFQTEIPHASVTGFTNAAFNSATAGKIRRQLTRTDLLGQIEEAGWRLEHASWVYVQTGQNSRDKFLASGQHVVVTGEVLGIYLFRRDDSRVETTKVKCHVCQHVQAVATNSSTFQCQQCNTQLKRRITQH